MKIGIIGCGLVGRKRAMAIGNHKLAIAVDTNIDRAKELATLKNCPKFSCDYKDALDDDEIDLIIIATTNDLLAEISLASVTACKHVLVEKPGARNLNEIIPVIETAEKNNVFVKVGFNHRYHPAFLKAKTMVDLGDIGQLMFIRARYGHGGRFGYEKEWRMNPEISGGGELIDQGVHLIDLSRWFMGELSLMNGFIRTYFWNTSVDDNAFVILKNSTDNVAWLHVSCTEWKNTFSFEIFGKSGKIHIEGLGGSYGTEKLYLYKMRPEMGPPETTIWEYPFDDHSWKYELDEFIRSIEMKRVPEGNIYDAKKALEIVEEIYSANDYTVK